MSFIVVGAAVVGVGATLGGMYMGGKGAQTQAEADKLKGLAGGVKQEQLGLLGDVRGQAITGAIGQANLGYDAAQSQFAGGQRDVSMGTQMGVRDIQAGGNIAMAQSGLATSGTIEQKTKTQTGDLMAKYKSDMTKLFETKELAGRQKDLAIGTSKEKADLAYRSGEMSAEEAYQNTLTDIESQPTGFLEGMFS